LVVALAAQDTLGNLFAGLMLIFDSPFDVGDTIIYNGQEVVVESIGARSTTLKTLENAIIPVTNKMLGNAHFVNVSARTHRIFNTNLHIACSNMQIDPWIQEVRQFLNSQEASFSYTFFLLNITTNGYAFQIDLVTKTNNSQEYKAIVQQVLIELDTLVIKHGLTWQSKVITV
jgi:MscS family membrane protein